MATYAELHDRHVRDLAALLPEHLDRLRWPAERLAAHRGRELRRLVRAARQCSPWHRQRLAGVDVDRLDEKTLAELPVMTKDDLMANFDAIVTDDRLSLDVCDAHLETLTEDAYLLDRYHVVASGGSTGRRGVFVYDWAGWTTMYLGIMRSELERQAAERRRHPGPVVMATVAAGRASHASKALLMCFASASFVVRGVPVTLPVDEIVAGLNEIDPDVVFAYPSALLPLAEEARAGRLRIRPRRSLVGAEPLFPEIRAEAEATWNVPVINNYGSSEAGGMAIACGQGSGLHVVEDLSIIEAVDETGRPVAPGERSAKVYVTNLYNHTLPLIRYEITDEVTLTDDRCPCGSAHRLMEDPQGRLDESFRYGSLVVHPLVFRSPLGLCRNIVEYQVRQTPRGADVAVVCQGRPDLWALADQIAVKLVTAGLNGAEVSVHAVDRLARQETGKLKRFVPIRGVVSLAA
ncbi:MAG TPA: phenylacetate--CoA ligase family protein [Acidimicrobiia bacterium]|nr:phenylacetate--CoA ligase family protein [Acidimicrobiia bacterium]